MAHKTKATMQGRQCSTENKEHGQHTRLVAGGQSVSTVHFCILGTAPMAQLMRNNQSPEFSVATISKIVGFIFRVGGTALQHTQYFPQWGECEPVAGTLILRTSFRVAQMQLGASPQSWGNQYFGYCESFVIEPTQLFGDLTYTKNAGQTPDLAFAQPFGSIPRDCSSFRKTRFIQVAREESPSFFISASSCARNSCWRRIWYWSVLVLVLDIVITKSILLTGSCNYNVTKMVLQLLNMTKPCSARTLTGPLTKPLIEVTVMADQQHTQTHPKFTWLFLATPKHYPECAPVVLRFDADTEANARIAFPGWELVFAAKIRAQAPCRVSFFDYSTRRGWEFDSAASQEIRHA